MSIFDIFAGMDINNIEKTFDELDRVVDDYFGKAGQRRRFMQACRKLSDDDLSLIQDVVHGEIRRNEISDRVTTADSPIRLANTLLMLESDIETTEDENIFFFLYEVVTRKNVIKGLDRTWFLHWEEPFLYNPVTPSIFVELIWLFYKDGKYDELYGIDIPGRIAQHPNCPTKVLNELLDCDDPVVRRAIAIHQNIDDKAIRFFLNSPRYPERERIAKSKYVSQYVLLSLMKDERNEVINTAKKNFRKRFPDEDITDESIDSAIAMYIDTPYVEPAEKPLKFEPHEALKQGVDYVLSIKSASQRARVAKAAYEADFLDALANDKSSSVRRVVAEDRRCSINVLFQLVHDKDIIVSNNAINTLSSLDKITTLEDLLDDDAVKSSHDLLNQYINKHGDLDYDDNLGKKVAAEIERVCIVARFTGNPMIQARIVNDLSETPDMSTMRWKLLSSLTHNKHLSDGVVRKIVFDLEFAQERVLCNCQNKELVGQLLNSVKLFPGERIRVEKHLKGL